MLITLHPTYTFRVEITDRPRALGNEIQAGETMSGRQFSDPLKNKTGCDEALMAVHEALSKAGIRNFTISLDRFDHKS